MVDCADRRVVAARVEPSQDRAQVHRLLDHVEVVVELEALPVDGLVERVGVGQLADLLDDLLGLAQHVARAQQPARDRRQQRVRALLEGERGVADLGALLVIRLGVLPHEPHVRREVDGRAVLAHAQLLLRGSPKPGAAGAERDAGAQMPCAARKRVSTRGVCRGARARRAPRPPAAVTARTLMVPRSIGCLTTLG